MWKDGQLIYSQINAKTKQKQQSKTKTQQGNISYTLNWHLVWSDLMFQENRKTGTLSMLVGVKLAQSLGRIVWQYLVMLKMHMPLDPVVPLLAM